MSDNGDPERNPATRKPYLSLFVVATVLVGCAIALVMVFLQMMEGFGTLSRLHEG